MESKINRENSFQPFNRPEGNFQSTLKQITHTKGIKTLPNTQHTNKQNINKTQNWLNLRKNQNYLKQILCIDKFCRHTKYKLCVSVSFFLVRQRKTKAATTKRNAKYKTKQKC